MSSLMQQGDMGLTEDLSGIIGQDFTSTADLSVREREDNILSIKETVIANREKRKAAIDFACSFLKAERAEAIRTVAEHAETDAVIYLNDEPQPQVVLLNNALENSMIVFVKSVLPENVYKQLKEFHNYSIAPFAISD